MKVILIAVDGILSDWRQRQHLSGAPEFIKREAIIDGVVKLLLSLKPQPLPVTAEPPAPTSHDKDRESQIELIGQGALS